MNPPFSEDEVEAIRQLAIQTDNPDDASIVAATKKDPTEIRNIIKRNIIPLRDEKITIDKIVQIFNSSANNSMGGSPRRSPRLAPRPIDVNRPNNIQLAPLSASTLALPPKYRGKTMPKTPNPSTLTNNLGNLNFNNNPIPFTSTLNQNSAISNNNDNSNKSNSNIFLNNNINQSTVNGITKNSNNSSYTIDHSSNLLQLNQQMPIQTRIPVLPRCESSPAMISHHKKDHIDPEIGSLAAVLHPSLGPAHVCRVLASRVQNRMHSYLVAFFQSGCSPCYVPSEYLFQLKAHVGFPLGNEEEFKHVMETEEISVDFLLERIFSSAQNLVINHAEVLFPPEQLAKAAFKPEPQQVQQIMFQCVSCAALLLVCYVSCEWSIPQDKLNLVLSTIMKTNPSKFTSTQNIMNNIQDSLLNLINLIEK